ncbi:mannonate dehydratase [Sodalis sp. dw_96]|uniref:mannonate dehydratase n=1 Tax=Sodalis sp. dw_96 TaxID=2719794 RepID=UPI001BD22DF9|nr:mannonate dehydratase [Sodalis sp. dw_96]
MKIIFRWHGQEDPVSLQYISQIPGLYGIVSSLYKQPLGTVWPEESLLDIKRQAAAHGLKFDVVDSFRIHEDIKLGKPGRDRLIAEYCENLHILARCGIKIICYNFMPVFDWTRTNLAYPLPDGSNTLAFDSATIDAIDPRQGIELPGWGAKYAPAQLQRLLADYANVDEEKLWQHLEYFLQKVIPVAKSLGLKLALHSDDPPRKIFGLPRILKNIDDHRRLLDIIDDPTNGLTVCTGSLGCDVRNNLPDIINEFAARDRVHFVHFRNVKVSSNGDFYESAHPSACGSLDMGAIMAALYDAKYQGYIRPDHGRMIWGETGVPGYGLHDRAMGIMYMQGLWEGLEKANSR